MRDDNSPSIRGLTAYYAVKMAYNLPLLGKFAKYGQMREILNEYEKEWKCPNNYDWDKLTIGKFNADLIGPKGWKLEDEDEAEDLGAENAGSAEDLSAENAGETEGEDSDPELRMILQLHGGGYYNKLHNAYRDVAVFYSQKSKGALVLSPDYATAPFHPFPAALEDAVNAYKYILNMGIKPENIVIAGDSAGGGLTLSLVLYLRNHDMPLPAGVITMSAWTDLTKSGKSYEENYETDPLFGNTKESLVYLEGYYRNSDPHNPYISPIFGDYKDFPPTLMQVGEMEMLLSDTTEVAKKMEEAGVDVKSHVYPGMFHVFQLGLNLFPEEVEAWNEIGEFFEKIWDLPDEVESPKRTDYRWFRRRLKNKS